MPLDVEGREGFSRLAEYGPLLAKYAPGLHEVSQAEYLMRTGGWDAAMAELSNDDRWRLKYDWEFNRRPDQVWPSDGKRIWLVMSGRGTGKSRTLVETVREAIRKGRKRIAIVCRTSKDMKRTMLRDNFLPHVPRWEWDPSQRGAFDKTLMEMTFKDQGDGDPAVVSFYHAEGGEATLGSNLDLLMFDEISTMRDAEHILNNSLMALRKQTANDGHAPCCIFSTPRNLDLLRKLVASDRTHVTTTPTFNNLAHLDDEFIEDMLTRYPPHSREAQQELFGVILNDGGECLWREDMIRPLEIARPDGSIVQRSDPDLLDHFADTCIGVDPAGAADEKTAHDEIGIAACGTLRNWSDYAVLESCGVRAGPGEWGKRVVDMALRYQASAIVYEKNFGGAMVEHTIRTACPDMTIPILPIHTTNKRHIRAQPIAALFDRGVVSILHGYGKYGESDQQPLIDQMLLMNRNGWGGSSDASPDRLDAVGFALRYLDRTGEAPSHAGVVTSALTDYLGGNQ